MKLMKKLLFILAFTIMNYFVINAQVTVDTLSLWNCDVLSYSGVILNRDLYQSVTED